MRDEISILLVDDQATEASRISGQLKAIGKMPKILLAAPKEEGHEHIIQLLPHSTSLNDFDLALVDLELWPVFKEGNAYSPEDLKGGTVVLQYLRDNAPWLPVICYSQLFFHLELFNMSTSFGFDAHLSKKWVTSPNFTPGAWDAITRLALQNRLRSAIGNSFVRPNNNTNINFSIKTKSVLEKIFNNYDWEIMLRTMFHFASNVFIESTTSGFSGAAAFVVNATTNSQHNNTNNQWFLKISSNCFKIHKEVCAHLNMFYSGIQYARSLPLMYNSVIRFGQCGVIAYQFAENTQVAANVLVSSDSFMEHRQRLYALIGGYSSHSKTSVRDCVLYSVLVDWFGPDFYSLDTFTPNDELCRYVSAILDQVETEPTQKHLRCTFAQIHGDLHLCNILFGERDVLIDFARSKSAPFVIDLAKLFSDIFIRVQELQAPVLPMMSKEGSEIYSLPSTCPVLTDDDKVLFDIFLRIYLLAALRYDDVPASSKSWIMKVLE